MSGASEADEYGTAAEQHRVSAGHTVYVAPDGWYCEACEAGTAPNPDHVTAAREWAADCTWVEDEDELAALSDADVVAGVQRHYAGGWAAFIRDGVPVDVVRGEAGHVRGEVVGAVLVLVLVALAIVGGCSSRVAGATVPTRQRVHVHYSRPTVCRVVAPGGDEPDERDRWAWVVETGAGLDYRGASHYSDHVGRWVVRDTRAGRWYVWGYAAAEDATVWSTSTCAAAHRYPAPTAAGWAGVYGWT